MRRAARCEFTLVHGVAMFAAPTRALLLLSTPILAAAADPPPSCLNVDRGQADGGDNACFEEDDVGMVCGWDGTPQEAYCTPRADGKKVCARWSAGGKCPEGSAVPDAACHDGGPFECKEEGCPPSGVVTCAELADACPARFDQVYDTSMPPGVDGATRVHQLCNCTCAGRERPPPRKPDRAAAEAKKRESLKRTGQLGAAQGKWEQAVADSGRRGPSSNDDDDVEEYVPPPPPRSWPTHVDEPPFRLFVDEMSRADRERCHIWQAVGCIDDQLEKACEEMSTASNRRIVDVKAPENVFMCCCPRPYGPCTKEERGFACDVAINHYVGPFVRNPEGYLPGALLAARNELVEGARYWEGDGVGPSCNALPDIHDGGYVELTEEEKRRARAGEVEGDADRAPTYTNWTSGVCGSEVGRERSIARQELFCEMAVWQWEELGDGDDGELDDNGCVLDPSTKASVRMGNARKGLRLEYEEGNRLMKALETKLDRDDHAKGQMNFHKQMHEGLRARGMEADLPPEENDDAEEEDEDEDEDDMEYYVDKDEV